MKYRYFWIFAFVGCLFIFPQNSFSEQVGKAGSGSAASDEELGTGEEVAFLKTSLGTIVISFFPEKAPKHVENFKKLAKKGFYNGTYFHRVIPGFMIQGGDPNTKDEDRTNDGMGGSGTHLQAEFNDIPHNRGIVSMARSRDPNSASSQFFIMVARAQHLDGQYSVFGRVRRGMKVVDKIVNAKKDQYDNPVEKVILESVTIQKM
ncbi:MAG: peptidylprolyl isomerase [Nitrospinota bacterium]|nr:peptidylprolyl isomerase [Nitrospinota bacterium]